MAWVHGAELPAVALLSSGLAGHDEGRRKRLLHVLGHSFGRHIFGRNNGSLWDRDDHVNVIERLLAQGLHDLVHKHDPHVLASAMPVLVASCAPQHPQSSVGRCGGLLAASTRGFLATPSSNLKKKRKEEKGGTITRM